MACPSFCRDSGCTKSYGAHMNFHVAAAARPTSRRALSVRRADEKEARWEKDIPAYRRLRADNLQPPRIDGAAALERDATCAEQVTMGDTTIAEQSFGEFADRFGHAATTPAPDKAA